MTLQPTTLYMLTLAIASVYRYIVNTDYVVFTHATRFIDKQICLR